MQDNETAMLQKMGTRIKMIRGRKNITQSRLAIKCGFEKARMSRIESGRANPTIKTLLKISEALDVPITELCGE